MQKYNKATSAFVSGVVGFALVKLGMSETGLVPAEFQPVVDGIVVAIFAALGPVFGPKNAE